MILKIVIVEVAMSITCEIFKEKSLFYTKCSGTISLQEFIRHQNEHGGNECLYGFNEIFDTREADFSQLGLMALQAIASRTQALDALSADSYLVVVVNSGINKMAVELYKMIEQVLGGKSRKMKIVTSPDDAYDFLNSLAS
jgi:hypothetical protein